MLECAAALQIAAGSDDNSSTGLTADLNQSRDGHVLGMMPNAPLNLSQLDLDGSYASTDYSFTESDGGIGNLDMSCLLGNIMEEEDEEQIERDIDNEFLFQDDEERIGSLINDMQLDRGSVLLDLKRERIEEFDVFHRENQNNPGADLKKSSGKELNFSPIQQGKRGATDRNNI
eukprot:10057267-Ditylum_brightwellii.AAC.1